MSKKNNEVARIDLYADLDKTIRQSLKTKYNSIQKNMLEIAKLSVKLSNQNEEQFINFAKNELNMSKGTISKFLTAGKICLTAEKEKLALPSSYSVVYNLHKVSAELKDFAEYYESENGEPLEKGSFRSIDTTVKNYINDSVDSEVTESTEIEQETESEVVEETEQETETEVIDNALADLLRIMSGNIIEMTESTNDTKLLELLADQSAVVSAMAETLELEI